MSAVDDSNFFLNAAAYSSRRWIAHFQQNRARLHAIPWHRGGDLTADERAAISRSIRAFQLGEQGDGDHLVHYAREWAKRAGDVDYVEAIRMLIAEEQRHARDLGRVMDLNGIPRLRRGWTDGIFRRLRNLLGSLEVSIAVLVTAEIIAKVYYVALRDATKSTVLRALCEQILEDEYNHVDFQTAQLAMLRRGRSAPLMFATVALQRLLAWTTTLIVAMSYRATLVRGGFSIGGFRRACASEFARDIAAMGPRQSAVDLCPAAPLKTEPLGVDLLRNREAKTEIRVNSLNVTISIL